MVLFTCAGQRVDIVKAFQAAGAIALGADADPLAPALYHADRRAIVPRIADPGYVAAHAVFAAAGAKVIRAPVDREGLDPAKLPRGKDGVRAVYVTPSHQFPTGAVMPVARRYALLEWAKQHRRLRD